MHMTLSHSCKLSDGPFKDLEEHSKNVHKTEQCLECTVNFTTTTGLQRHLSQIHLVLCNICNKQLFNKQLCNKQLFNKLFKRGISKNSMRGSVINAKRGS